MSRNRLEKVDMIKLNRNILFKNLPSGSKLIFDHSQLCTRRAQGEWDCILGLYETTNVEPPHVKSFASFPQVYMAWVPLLFGRPPSYWFSAYKVKPMLQNIISRNFVKSVLRLLVVRSRRSVNVPIMTSSGTDNNIISLLFAVVLALTFYPMLSFSLSSKVVLLRHFSSLCQGQPEFSWSQNILLIKTDNFFLTNKK